MENLNLLFNKTYYEKLGHSKEVLEGDLKSKNETIFSTAFDPEKDIVANELARPEESFRLMTTYPGMLMGTGNPHGTGAADADINVGFSFDYVSGQPYIPGSTVKGILRSFFKDKEKRAAVSAILKTVTGNNYEDDQIEKIRDEIFEGNDVFFDAVVVRGGRYNEILGPDYLTPHKETIKNPIPIYIIKVIPDVVFEFRFRLRDEGTLDKKTRIELFKTILKLFGAGAKTNTGYGRLVECKDLEPQYRGKRQKEYKKDNKPSGMAGGGQKKRYHENNNPVVSVKVKRITRSGGIVIIDGDKEGMIGKNNVGSRQVSVGDEIEVRFSGEKTYDDGNTVRYYVFAKPTMKD